ncbi:FecR family protein [Marinobacterium arenosum]|uniref:FecR family protein n=1 Tax=Marinobacterium arenosum TaxID=2862496 RepID=UPI001C97AD81|nr:FecR family protein [Marinobacterium arenosum]MBY4676823.1 FecR family protein [Marinobacterium arenosum]
MSLTSYSYAIAGSEQPAQTVAAQVAGTVLFATGARERFDANQVQHPVKRGQNVFVGDRIITRENGHIQLKMADGGYLSLRPSSTLTIEAYSVDPSQPTSEKVKLNLSQGTLRSVTGGVGERSKGNFRLNTPVAAIGIRGTDFSVFTSADISRVMVSRGGIAMSPFGDQCSADALGACQGSQVRELFAGQAAAYLELTKGTESPRLLEGQLEQLLPQIDELFESSGSTTPKTDTSDDTAIVKPLSLPPEIEALLQASLDQDQDRDGIPDYQDSEPNDPAQLVDTDKDGIANWRDLDDDGDGIADVLEQHWLMDPLQADSDQDGINDVTELMMETNPLSADTDGDGVLDGSDRRPLQQDHFTIGGVTWSFDDLAQAQVSTASETRAIGSSLWQMDIVASQSGQADSGKLTAGLDAVTGIWWGDAQTLKVVQQLMAQPNWDDVQKSWALNLILGQTDGNTLKSLIPLWQQQPGYILGNDQLSIMLDIAPEALQQQTYTYRPQWQIDSAQTANFSSYLESFSMESLTVDAENGLFEARVSTATGGNRLIRGRVDNGMLFGGDSDFQLEGGIVDEDQLVLVLGSGDHSTLVRLSLDGTSQLKLAQTWQQIQPNQQANTGRVEWGRWSNFAELDAQDAQLALREGYELVGSNSHFALFRPQSGDLNLPDQGRFAFNLNDYEAVYQNGSHIESASVNNAALEVDFNQNRFAMQMGVDAPSLSTTESLRSYGSLSDQGLLQSESGLSNTRASGFIGENALDAGLLFEKELTDNSRISGVSYWKRAD